MRQRLALARAYAVKPEFLLMDEPFGALDAQTRTAMQDLLLHVLQTEGKTVLLITHSVDEAIYLSSRIVVVTARPARVRAVIDVPFGYPRDEARARGPALRRRCARTSATLVMQEYAAQAQPGRARPIDLTDVIRPSRQTASLTTTGDDHDPPPQNPASGRRRRRHRRRSRLRRRVRAGAHQAARSATCTRRRSTARSGSASNRARGPSAASTSS